MKRMIALATMMAAFSCGGTDAQAGEQGKPGSHRQQALRDYFGLPYQGFERGPFSIFSAGPLECIRFTDPKATSRCDSVQRCMSPEREKALLGEANQDGLSDLERFHRLNRVAANYMYSGKKFPEAIATYEKMVGISRKLDKETQWVALVSLGLARMKYGEAANCVANHGPESCIFPLSKEAQHRIREGSEKAIEAFREALGIKSTVQLQWLYNFSNMTLGRYPAMVEKQWRMPGTHLRSSISFPRFPDIGPSLETITDRQTGVLYNIADEFNNDGYLDLVMGQKSACDGMRYFESTPAGFVEKTEGSGLENEKTVSAVAQADFDNDGYLDLYLSRGAWDGNDSVPPLQNSLMRNLGGGKFANVTEQAGLLATGSNHAAAWADFDNDGWVDLFVCSETKGSALYMNEKGKFANKIGASGIPGDFMGRCKGIAAGDVNNDGNMDLFLSFNDAPNQLWLGKGDGTFTKANQPLVERFPSGGFTAWFFDYDNDGWLDLYVSDYSQSAGEEVARFLFNQPYGASSRLFHNKGNGEFEDVSQKVGLKFPSAVMGAAPVDLDNDGFPDLVLGMGGMSFGDVVPNMVFLNQKGKRFVDVSQASGMSSVQKGHAVTVADFNNDGYLDVLKAFGGPAPADRFVPSLHLNPGGFGNHFVEFKLEGTQSNRAAIGARVHVKVTARAGGQKDFYGVVGNTSSFGSSPLRLHFGIGKATKIETVEIRWPNKGKTRQTFQNLASDSLYYVKEGAEKAELRPHNPVTMKTKASGHHHHE